MPSFSFLKSAILTIPVGWVVGELRNRTKLQPSSVEVELWLSLAKSDPKVSVNLSLLLAVGFVGFTTISRSAQPPGSELFILSKRLELGSVL